jgi:hypothetical protein
VTLFDVDGPEPVMLVSIPVCGLCVTLPACWRVEVHGAAADVCAKCRRALGTVDAAPLRDAAREAPRPNTNQVQRYLAAQRFRVARTVPEHPHEYLLVTASTDPWLHLRVIAYLADRGYQETWRPAPGAKGTTYTYWRGGDGWEYWASPPASAGGWRPPQLAATVINRRRWTPEGLFDGDSR